VAGEPVRVAARIDRRPGPEQPRFVIAQVAETLNKRRELASDVVTGVLLPQFALIPLSVVLVWFGLTRGIAPLARLQARIRQRRPTDLSPIAPESVPEEVRPLIVAFNDMMARLEENLQAQRRFIADAAHQMRTPITGLKMQAELALRERDPQALRQDLQRLHGAAERAAHLIQQLLTLARAESSSETVHRIERLDVQELLRDVALELYPKAQHKALELGFDESEGRLEVEGNRLMLQELFKNLVDNAIQYTPPGGSVTLRALARGDSIDVEIEDTGIGIPPADRPRVFERFYRVLDTGVDGSGLGLAIVREIAEMHRADVSLEPNPHGQGTLARVRFPLPARSPARQDERPRAKDD
jgi:two-component system sensor histidine kinase TctE